MESTRYPIRHPQKNTANVAWGAHLTQRSKRYGDWRGSKIGTFVFISFTNLDWLFVCFFYKSLLLLVSVAHLLAIKLAFLCVPWLCYLMCNGALVRHNVQILVNATRWSANHDAAFDHMGELEIEVRVAIKRKVGWMDLLKLAVRRTLTAVSPAASMFSPLSSNGVKRMLCWCQGSKVMRARAEWRLWVNGELNNQRLQGRKIVSLNAQHLLEQAACTRWPI